ncbi:MAG TPA: branched-chain amino acid ABC transporter ATP-binding protein/permease [Actinomycetota bacterium]|nr:branched-chain amino acid ABC transporter ATP-binding protein/permease [Actinomycetota bacterium]
MSTTGTKAGMSLKGFAPSPRQIKILIVAASFIILPPLLARAIPGIFTDYRALMLGVATCYVAAALSLNLLMGYAGQISLGHGALLGTGAFASGLVTTRGPELPLYAGLLAAVLFGAILAFLVGLPALRLRGLYLAIATIGFAFMMQESVFRWQPITRGSAGLELPRRLSRNWVLTENADYLALALVVALFVWLLDVNVVRTKLGRAFHAIREDEAVAQSFGIDITRYKLTAFVLSGSLAGLSGALYGHLIGFVNSDTFSYDAWSLFLVVLVVVGGLGNRKGVAVAAVFFALTPRLLQSIEGWDLIIGAFLLVYTMANHPGGFAEVFHEVRMKRQAKRDPAPEDLTTRLPKLPAPKGAAPPPTEGGGPILEVSDVRVSFGGLVAVDGVSLEVPAGKIIGLIGPNGAGKTTLFNAISGLVKPDAGDIKFQGESVTALSPHARAALGMGRTFQLIGLAKNLSVQENFLMAQHASAIYGDGSALLFTSKAARIEAELIDRAREAIESLGFERYAETPVKNLSHGQQRLVEIACALITSPSLLMLDEPSAGFAPAAVESLAERLKEIRDELGRTVLLIEHNIPMVLSVCDYIYVLNFGSLLAEGTPDEVASHPEVITAYLGQAAQPVPA